MITLADEYLLVDGGVASTSTGLSDAERERGAGHSRRSQI